MNKAPATAEIQPRGGEASSYEMADEIEEFIADLEEEFLEFRRTVTGSANEQ